MSWNALAVGIRTIITADIGSGGLLNASTPLVTGAYNTEAAQGVAFPYLVYSTPTLVESKHYASGGVVDIDVDFTIMVAPTAGPTAAETIARRVRTLFDRVAVTAEGGAGWTARKMFRSGSIGPVFDDHMTQLIEQYRAALVA